MLFVFSNCNHSVQSNTYVNAYIHICTYIQLSNLCMYVRMLSYIAHPVFMQMYNQDVWLHHMSCFDAFWLYTTEILCWFTIISFFWYNNKNTHSISSEFHISDVWQRRVVLSTPLFTSFFFSCLILIWWCNGAPSVVRLFCCSPCVYLIWYICNETLSFLSPTVSSSKLLWHEDTWISYVY